MKINTKSFFNIITIYTSYRSSNNSKSISQTRNTPLYKINTSTYGADASVLVQMST